MKRLTISQEFGELGKDSIGEWFWNSNMMIRLNMDYNFLLGLSL